MLVLANQTLEADELMSELQRIDSMGKATYYVCVPASAVETGTASTHGAVSVRDATTEAAQARLDRTLEALHGTPSRRHRRTRRLPTAAGAAGGGGSSSIPTRSSS